MEKGKKEKEHTFLHFQRRMSRYSLRVCICNERKCIHRDTPIRTRTRTRICIRKSVRQIM